MTVKQLINLLRSFPEDAEVHVAQPQHDHLGRSIASPADDVEWQSVYESSYFGALTIANSDREYEPGELTDVLVVQ